MLLSAHALYPPMRSETSVKPCDFNKLLAIEDRYPPAQFTTTGTFGSSSGIVCSNAGKGTLRAPGSIPNAVSPALRTSMTTNSRSEAMRSANDSMDSRDCFSTSSGCFNISCTGLLMQPTTLSKPMRARRIRASCSNPASETITMDVPGFMISPAYSAKRPERPTFTEPRMYPDAND